MDTTQLRKKTKGYESLEAPVLQILELQIGWNIGDLARTSEYETPKLKFMTAAEANHAAFAFLLCFFLGDMQDGNVHSVGYSLQLDVERRTLQFAPSIMYLLPILCLCSPEDPPSFAKHKTLTPTHP